MKNKRVLNAIFTFSFSMAIVLTVVLTFSYCHQNILNNEILFFYESSEAENIEYINGLKSALGEEEHKFVITPQNTAIINYKSETKYITGDFINKAAVKVFREDVIFINTLYDAKSEFNFPNIMHLAPSYELYGTSLLNEAKPLENATAFIADTSDVGEMFSDLYAEESLALRTFLENNQTNFTDQVNYLISNNVENIILALDHAYFTSFVHFLSESSFAGNVYIPDFYFKTDFSVPSSYKKSKFTLNYLSSFNFDFAIATAPKTKEKHHLLKFYQGYAAGKLILALEKANVTTFNDDVFINEVNLSVGPQVLSNFIYD